MKKPVEQKKIQQGNKIGDIFQIPIDGDRFVVGQIIDRYKSTLLLVVFSGLFRCHIDTILELKERSPVLLASTFDALLHNGSWPVICNDSEHLCGLQRPEFLIGPNENCSVEDFYGRPLRKATARDLEFLGYRNFVAPIRVQKAAQA